MHVSCLFSVRLYVRKSGRYIDTALRTPHITAITDLFCVWRTGASEWSVIKLQFEQTPHLSAATKEQRLNQDWAMLGLPEWSAWLIAGVQSAGFFSFPRIWWGIWTYILLFNWIDNRPKCGCRKLPANLGKEHWLPVLALWRRGPCVWLDKWLEAWDPARWAVRS